MKKLIREPLIHFVLLGGALFGVYFFMHRGDSVATPQDIVVTSGQIQTLAIGFTRVWQRPPTDVELKGLIDNYIKEEILAREAVKLGLDQNDSVIRRRLQQKMDFVAEEFVDGREPTDAELADYLAKHPGRFAEDRRFTFRQIFLDRQKRGDHLDADAAALLTKLKEQPSREIESLGDPLLLPQECADAPQRDVAAQFGQAFAASLSELAVAQWSGPVESGYGVHLVLLARRTDGKVPPLDEVRDQVKRDLVDARRAEANQRFFDSLLAKYHVTVQGVTPPAATTERKVAMN